MTAGPLRNRIVGTGSADPESLLANPANWRTHPDFQAKALEGILEQVGWVQNVIVNQRTGHLVDGHLRVELALKRSEPEIPVVYVDLSDDEESLILATLDPISGLAGADDDLLTDLLDRVEADNAAVKALLEQLDPRSNGDTTPAEARESLASRFLVPPFSILDGRSGQWQDRKRAWLALGLRSEQGRKDNLAYSTSSQPPAVLDRKREIERRDGQTYSWKEFADKYPEEIAIIGTSVFDPVVCELAYRWFAPEGGRVLDPFAGGSVRGTVAGMLGYAYTGIDLRAEQVRANRLQWLTIGVHGGIGSRTERPDYQPDLTPVEQHGDAWAKRDDLYTVGGVSGGKVRTCWTLSEGAAGLTTAGSRASPQVNIVAHIAKRRGIPCRVHTPSGDLSPEVQAAATAGADVVQHKAGYNNVIIARAREDADLRNWTEIPFGMECPEAVEATAGQTANIPPETQRIVMPVGSGMSLAGVLTGLAERNLQIPVLGVVVGADPSKRLDKYAPAGWRDMVTLVPSGSDYHEPAQDTEWRGIVLDPHYEAKAAPFVQPGDLFWIVGIRQTALPPDPGTAVIPNWIHGDSTVVLDAVPDESHDLVFSCPPYADLEQYSDDPNDLSNMDYDQFVDAYRAIIGKAARKLRPNRFAVWVVGEVRDPRGNYRDFVGDTVQAFEDAGLRYYNEALLLTPLGSLAMRAANYFVTSRKLAKGHQNVLVFRKEGDDETVGPDLDRINDLAASVAESFRTERKLLAHASKVLVFAKGDPKQAADEFGQPDFDDPIMEALTDG